MSTYKTVEEFVYCFNTYHYKELYSRSSKYSNRKLLKCEHNNNILFKKAKDSLQCIRQSYTANSKTNRGG